MLLHSAVFQRNLTTKTQNDFEAHAIIGRVKQAFESFLTIQETTESVFINGQPYKIETYEDKETAYPLERLSIRLTWKDTLTSETVVIEETSPTSRPLPFLRGSPMRWKIK